MLRQPIAAVCSLVAFALFSHSAVAQSDADICMAMPAQIQQLVTSAGETAPARKAISLRDTGIKLCEAGNRRAAQKKFKEALSLLEQSKTS